MAEPTDYFKSLLGRCRSFLFVPKCAVCMKRVDFDEFEKYKPLCSECYDKWLAEISSPCPLCGRRPGDCICGVSVDKNRRIDSEIHLAAYNTNNDIARRLVLLSKIKNRKYVFNLLIDSLSDLINERLAVGENTVLTYIPRVRSKISRIGHDQCRITAEGISEKTGIPLMLFIRHDPGGKQQKTLDYTSRKANARRSYALIAENTGYIRGREVIIYDDTITTGATMTRCAGLLKSAGAAKVYALSITKSCRY